MPLYRNADDEAVLIGGGWRIYWREPGAAAYEEVGHVTDLKENRAITKNSVSGSKTPARSPIRTSLKENVTAISMTPITLNSEVIRMAAMAAGWTAVNQPADSCDLSAIALVADGFVEMLDGGKLIRDAFVTKIPLSGVSGSFTIGETVTGGTSSATGKVAWKDSGLVELIEVSGEFVAGEVVTGGTSAAHGTSTSVQVVEDIVLVNSATPTTRYVLGTDYDVDLDAGMVLKKSTGSIGATAYAAYQYPELLGEVAYRDSGPAIITKEVRMEPDKDNDGPRIPRYYPKVDFAPSGEWLLFTDADNPASLTFEGSVVEDGNKPAGQRFGTVTVIKKA